MGWITGRRCRGYSSENARVSAGLDRRVRFDGPALASVAPSPGWNNLINRRGQKAPLPMVCGDILLLATASTTFYGGNPLLIARCFG